MGAEARHRLLIVDDSETFRLALEAEAKASGRFAHVTTAVDGRQALEQIHAALREGSPAGAPDIVIADFYMPDLNGVELLHALKKHPHTAGILGVMISVCESPAERAAAREAGARAFFIKPSNAIGMRGLLEAASWLAESAGVRSTSSTLTGMAGAIPPASAAPPSHEA